MPTSYLSGKEIPSSEVIKGSDIRDGVLKLIQIKNSGFSESDYISLDELNSYRKLFLAKLVTEEKGELATLDRDVLAAIKDNSILSENLESQIDSKLSLGQKVADKIAEFGGSWTFIILCFWYSG